MIGFVLKACARQHLLSPWIMDLNSWWVAGGSNRKATMLWLSENFRSAIWSAPTEPSEKTNYLIIKIKFSHLSINEALKKRFQKNLWQKLVHGPKQVQGRKRVHGCKRCQMPKLIFASINPQNVINSHEKRLCGARLCSTYTIQGSISDDNKNKMMNRRLDRKVIERNWRRLVAAKEKWG